MVGFSKSIALLASPPTVKAQKSKTSKNDKSQIGLGKMKKKRKKVIAIDRKKSKKRKNLH